MQRDNSTSKGLISKIFAASMIVMVASAWIAPAANAQLVGGGGVIDGIGDPVGGGDTGGGSDIGGDTGSGLVGGITDGLEGGSEGSIDDGSGGGGTGGGLVGGIVDNVTDGVDDTKDTVDETTGGTTGHIGSGVTNTVETVTETADRTGQGLLGKDGNKKKSEGRDRNRSTSTSTSQPGTAVLGESMADAMRADGKLIAAFDADTESAGSTIELASSESVMTQIGRVAAEAVQQAAFPIALILMVGAFLMVQNRIDSKDPKLALAPVDSEHDLLSFT